MTSASENNADTETVISRVLFPSIARESPAQTKVIRETERRRDRASRFLVSSSDVDFLPVKPPSAPFSAFVPDAHRSSTSIRYFTVEISICDIVD